MFVFWYQNLNSKTLCKGSHFCITSQQELKILLWRLKMPMIPQLERILEEERCNVLQFFELIYSSSFLLNQWLCFVFHFTTQQLSSLMRTIYTFSVTVWCYFWWQWGGRIKPKAAWETHNDLFTSEQHWVIKVLPINNNDPMIRYILVSVFCCRKPSW